VAFKDLQKVIESQTGQGLDQLQRLRGKPFWYWDKTRHKSADRITKGECLIGNVFSELTIENATKIEYNPDNINPNETVANEYKLDKEVTSYSDTLDAFRLALQFYKRSKQ
jgi:hypothetical protein